MFGLGLVLEMEEHCLAGAELGSLAAGLLAGTGFEVAANLGAWEAGLPRQTGLALRQWAALVEF